MKGWIGSLVLVGLAMMGTAYAEENFEMDVIKTQTGELRITFIGHGTLMFAFNGKVIHVDPWGQLADYTKLPKADMILITHEHGDHLDSKAVETLRTESTVLIYTETCAKQIPGGIVMANGDIRTELEIPIEAVPAYNLVQMRSPGNPYHPKGIGNGYVLTFGDQRVYIAGDTENTPEMKSLKNINIAFLPMNLPYTMTPEMVADAAKALNPAILYPYHFGETDTGKIVSLLKDEKIELRIRKMN